MKRAVAIVAGVAMVCLVAYLSLLNPAPVEFRLTPTRSLSGQLGALMVLAFIAGALCVLLVVSVQAGHRAIAAWRSGRRQRRSARIDEWEEHGEHLVWQGDAHHGRALLQKAWHRRPQSAHAVLALAASYRDTGELHRARGLLFDAANQHHTNPDVLFALAEVHRAAGERAPCIEVLERLRALHPRAPRVLRALREVYIDAGRWHDAAALQDALIGELRDPQQAAREREYAAVLRYQAALDLSDAPALVAGLEALADSRPASVPILVSLGDALLTVGREGEAAVLWERALRSTPRTVLVERLARIATEPRHRERLRGVLRKLRANQLRADNVHLLTAQLHIADGRPDEAARELDAVQSPTTAPPLLHRLWAEVHRRRGQIEQALTAYARADGPLSSYRCIACERSASEWVGLCPRCHQWDSYRSDVEIAAS